MSIKEDAAEGMIPLVTSRATKKDTPIWWDLECKRILSVNHLIEIHLLVKCGRVLGNVRTHRLPYQYIAEAILDKLTPTSNISDIILNFRHSNSC